MHIVVIWEWVKFFNHDDIYVDKRTKKNVSRFFYIVIK